jgi:hypothetical protein
MKRIKLTIAIFLMTGLTPCLFAQDCQDATQSLDVLNNESNVLKDLLGKGDNKDQIDQVMKLIKKAVLDKIQQDSLCDTIKGDRLGGKEYIDRLKKLIKDKGKTQ